MDFSIETLSNEGGCVADIEKKIIPYKITSITFRLKSKPCENLSTGREDTLGHISI